MMTDKEYLEILMNPANWRCSTSMGLWFCMAEMKYHDLTMIKIRAKETHIVPNDKDLIKLDTNRVDIKLYQVIGKTRIIPIDVYDALELMRNEDDLKEERDGRIDCSEDL